MHVTLPCVLPAPHAPLSLQRYESAYQIHPRSNKKLLNKNDSLNARVLNIEPPTNTPYSLETMSSLHIAKGIHYGGRLTDRGQSDFLILDAELTSLSGFRQ